MRKISQIIKSILSKSEELKDQVYNNSGKLITLPEGYEVYYSNEKDYLNLKMQGVELTIFITSRLGVPEDLEASIEKIEEMLSNELVNQKEKRKVRHGI